VASLAFDFFSSAKTFLKHAPFDPDADPDPDFLLILRDKHKKVVLCVLRASVVNFFCALRVHSRLFGVMGVCQTAFQGTAKACSEIL
jgi:hypothetical protein